jgi:type IV pilus assembly protein PilY1
VSNTNTTLTNANQAVIDRQGELTTATTVRSDALIALDAANLLVSNTNTALSDLQDIIADYPPVKTNRDSAKRDYNDGQVLVVTTTVDKVNANLAILDRQAELATAFNIRTTATEALNLAIGVREQAETDEATAFAAIASALADIAPKTTTAADADQAQVEFYGKGLLNIDAGDLASEHATASDNLTTATEGLTEATDNAGVTATNLLNANTALANANAARVAAQSTYDAAVLAVLNHNVFLNYLKESSGAEANKLVNYIRGEEQSGYRSRTIGIDGDGNPIVWRLGDIVHSTPALVGAPGDRYDVLYNDTTYATYREQYKDRRQVVYVGANDGMLHAFNAGFWNEKDKKFELDDSFVSDSSGLTQHPLGSEMWSYIPRSVLPHLRWLKDSGYGHSYYVDGEPLIFDANIFPADSEHPDGWGTVLVVGLRFGGAKMDIDSDGDGVNDTTTYPSYILMDVTNPEAPPKLIAEISHSELGFTTSKPAVVKKRTPKTGTSYSTTDENEWQLVFGSGPTVLANATSVQNAKLFVYDLITKSFVTGFAPKDISSESASFVGDISVANWDDDFVDDTAYFGVIGGDPSTPTGKVMRYRLDQSSASAISTLVDTNRATVGKPLTVVDGTGRKWIYFGTGRLFDGDDNSSTSLQRYYGVMEPLDAAGVTTWNAVNTSTLQNTTDIRIFDNGDLTTTTGVAVEIPNGTSITTYSALKAAIPKHKGGWFRNLYKNSTEPTGRNISESAKSRSIIFFTEYKPNHDSCRPEGTSLLYGVDYQTGTAVPFTVFGVDSSVTNNSGELAETAVDLGQGMASAPKVIENNSGSRTDSSDPIVSIITQSSTGVLQVDLATVGTFATGRASWMQIELD